MLNGREARRAVALALAAACCAQGAAAETGAQAAPPTSPGVAARADALLKAMGDYLAASDEFAFTADVTFDHVLPTGQTLQFSASEEVDVKRPNRVRVDWQGDLGERRFWYDGSSVTLVDPSTPFHAVAPAPASIDATLDMLEKDLAFTPPLADFLYADPYAALMAGARYGVYVGTAEVEGQECHQLAFVANQIDWQLWINAGARPTPCKLVISYLTRPGSPQFSATFTNWDFAPRIADTSFAADLPPGSRAVPFHQERPSNQP
ncbi:MAG: DUF2092 domain-containing protein [Amaricoccus sp.]